MHPMSRVFALACLLVPAALAAQQPAASPLPSDRPSPDQPHPTTAAEAPNHDTSYIDEKGTAHVTRFVPVPDTISIQSQHFLSHVLPDQGSPESLAERRKGTDAYTAHARMEWTQVCPNQIVEDKIAGVPVRIVTPDGMPEANNSKVLLNLHGGGFNSDSGSYT